MSSPSFWDLTSWKLSNAGLHAVIDVVTAYTDAFIKFSNEWRIVLSYGQKVT